MNVLLKCENLSKRYGNIEALNSINLTLESGKIIGMPPLLSTTSV